MLKHHGFHFRRQAPIGDYVVDFVCHRAKLVIELDGSHHAESKQMEHDAKRTAFLESAGYRVHRFWNIDTFRREEDVAEYIYALARQPPPACAAEAASARRRPDPDALTLRRIDLPSRGRLGQVRIARQDETMHVKVIP
jgi:very-short-patch-repair endonuclease